MLRKKDVVCILILLIIMLFCISIIIRFFTRQVFIIRLGIRNDVTDYIFCGNEDVYMNTPNAETNNIIERNDWYKDYPFSFDVDYDDKLPADNNNNNNNLYDTYIGKINFIKERIDSYTTEFLLGYQKLSEASKAYDQLICWNYSSFSEYNGIIKLEDGYLTGVNSKVDVSEHIDSVAMLNDYCVDRMIDFMYVQAPYKIDVITDWRISGYSDFSNQNASELLRGLDEAGVSTIDFPTIIKDEQINNHELFYKTDRHWKTDTGIWATKIIAEKCNYEFGFSMPTDELSVDNFRYDYYPMSFLGSEGKKVTLAQTSPDDFKLFYPLNNKMYYFEIKGTDVVKQGDFSVFYDLEAINKPDMYQRNLYSDFLYGEHALMYLKQEEANEELPRILIIHDSFGDCVVQMLTLCANEVFSVDLRAFNGSLKYLIDDLEPDLVIVLYNPSSISEIDYTKHSSMFDFR